jgi:hypothetical protein
MIDTNIDVLIQCFKGVNKDKLAHKKIKYSLGSVMPKVPNFLSTYLSMGCLLVQVVEHLPSNP